MATTLGPFDLSTPIAAGAMGVVWRGVHRDQGVAVAVKVVTARHARDPEYLAAFRDEVRAVAGLAHPGIVHVLDDGEVPGDTPDLPAGSPYLVMEHASGGTLSDPANAPADWTALVHVLDRLLDALAHAHARGVVHRDLKPGNVLVAGPSDARPGVKLSDFGIAAVGGRATHEHAGTPTYMAPEQLRGRVRDLGPWTDLYALGGLGWRLCCGSVPFAGLSGPALTLAQLERSPGRFLPRLAVPDAFEGWLRRLLEKDPADRFACAADAAWVLHGVAGSVTLGTEGEASADAEAPTRIRTSSSTATVLRPTRAAPTGRPAAAVRAWTVTEQPPVAPTWRRPEVPAVPPRLLGAGLGLLDLRTVPLVGRVAERDTLWGALRQVNADGTPRRVVLRGAEGLGRSRLLAWFAERVHETGAAIPLVVAPASNDDDLAVVRAVARHLGTEGLEGQALHERVVGALVAADARDPSATEITARLTPGLARALCAILDPGAAPLPEGVRRRALADWIARLAVRRPVVLLVDDAERSPDALALADALSRRRTAVLAVLALRDDVPLQAVEEGATGLDLAALAPHEHRTLIERLLPLEADTLDAVLRRTAGNPLFTVQLLSDWVARGRLHAGPRGFGAPDPRSLEGPRLLQVVWRQRVWPLLAVRPPEARGWLERAAVLGARLRDAEWHATCADGRDGARRSLAGALVGAGLWLRAGDAWIFRHAALREVLIDDSRRSGRLSEHHRACAWAMRRGDPRRGAHLLGAGEPAAALEALLEALLHERRAEGRQGLLLVEQAERALAALELPASDERRGRVAHARMLALDALDLDTAAADAADRLADDARRHGWQDTLWRALRMRGWIAQVGREWDLAERCYREGLSAADRLGSPEAHALLLGHLAGVLDDVGRSTEARPLREAARRAFEALGDRSSSCALDVAEADREVRSGRLDEAEALYRRALGRSEGLPHMEAKRARWLNDLAEIERRRGGTREGVALLEASIALHERYGGRYGIGHLNLALARLADRDHAGAAASVEVALEALATAGPVTHVGGAHAVAVACAAGAGDWDGFDFHLREARSTLHQHRLYAADAAEPLEHAARLADGAGERGRSAAAWRLAAEVWAGAGLAREAARALERATGPPV